MKCWFLILVLAVTAASSSFAGHLTTVTERAVAESVKVVDVDIKLGSGRFDVVKGADTAGAVATLTGKYDESKYEYDYYFAHTGKRGDLTFSSEMRSHFHTKIDSQDNIWEIGFSPNVDIRCNFDIGAAKSDLDFSDLSISELELNVGAAAARVDFSTPNKTSLTLFKIKAGACDLDVSNIGNSRFDRLDFEGGVGSFQLDFSGKFDYSADAKISVGLGSVDIILPSDLGVRLESDDNFLSSVDFPKRLLIPVRGREGIYETDNYDTAKGQLTIRLKIGLGSADIKFR